MVDEAPTPGLERSCSDRLWSREAGAGVQLLRAWFSGRPFERHRHDTYGICLTDAGVQSFDYRGATRHGTPGDVSVLHPDEPHDGRAGTPAGFGYRIVYVAPARVHEAARAIRGRACALPFVREPVSANARLARAIEAAFVFDPEPLAVDALVARLTEALIEAAGDAAPVRCDEHAVARARAFLDGETARVVRSSELEAVSGLTRYDVARQFRAAYGTSPYRYSLMRRLDRAIACLRSGGAPAEAALMTGFADQAHLSRMFKAAFGMTPGRYRALASFASTGASVGKASGGGVAGSNQPTAHASSPAHG